MITLPQPLLWKSALASITYGFNFGTSGQILGGDTLSSPVIHYTGTDSNLTIGTPAINVNLFYGTEGEGEIQAGQGAICQISGGTANVTYTLYCRVTTSSGDTIEIQGQLSILPSA